MSKDTAVYDLGHVEDVDARLRANLGMAPDPADRSDGAMRLRRTNAAYALPVPTGASPALTGSLSLFVPGAGQLAAGDATTALFFAASAGFVAAATWALRATWERLLPTLDLLGWPRAGLALMLVVLGVAAACLHVAAILHAFAARHPEGDRGPAHPAAAGLASAILPGWGQILAGKPGRAAFFVSWLWACAAAWILVTPAGTAAATQLGFDMPAALRDGWGPVAMITAPAVGWVLAVYDAAVSAKRGQG